MTDPDLFPSFSFSLHYLCAFCPISGTCLYLTWFPRPALSLYHLLIVHTSIDPVHLLGYRATFYCVLTICGYTRDLRDLRVGGCMRIGFLPLADVRSVRHFYPRLFFTQPSSPPHVGKSATKPRFPCFTRPSLYSFLHFDE